MCADKEQRYLGRRTGTSVWVLFELMTRYTQVNESGGFVVSDRDSIPTMGLKLAYSLPPPYRLLASNQGTFREDRLA